MTLSLRQRILLTVAPLLLLAAGMGTAGVVLLDQLGDRAKAILRENYDSVRAMFRLNESLERIDSAFQSALAGREADARRQYEEHWPRYEEQLRVEQGNITLPGEAELAERLAELTRQYRSRGDRFFARPAGAAERQADYDSAEDPTALLALFRGIKAVSGDILRINQENMEQASRDAAETAATSLVGSVVGLAVSAALATWLTWRLIRLILRPIAAVTEAAVAVGAGQLQLTVPVTGHDELARLAGAFNRMTDQLRDYRQSNATRLLRAQRTGQATIDSFADPVLVVDPEGRVELANPAAREVLGVVPPAKDAPAAPWQPPKALQQPLTDALHEQRPSLTEAFDQALTLRLRDEERAYLPQVRPIRDPYGHTLGAAVVLNDVTRFRLLDQLKSDLVATVSHELKTPLTSVRLAVHLLLEESVGPLTPKQTELLLDARDNAERLVRLIEHMLALARLQQGQKALQLRPERPADLLHAAVDAAAARARDKHVELTLTDADGLPPVAADAERLGHALHNLLDNALAYTEAGGRVTLSADADGSDGVRLTVADTGLGIPADALPHVFDRFFRVPGQSRPEGTGLGLAIVREIVQAHGGSVRAESQPGRGTAFHLTLPVWRGES